MKHPQVIARDMIKTVHHPKERKIKLSGSPVKFRSKNPEIGPAPMLGEHTSEALKDFLGMNNEEIYKLKRKGVI